MFNRKCSLIGCVHVLPLPGSAGYRGSVEEIVEAAVVDAKLYKDNGIDAVIVENMHDVPYLNGYVDPETVAAMTAVARSVKQAIHMPMGVQLLAGANLEALGVAVAASLEFIRVEGFVYAHIGDEGTHESCAAKLLRRRATLRAQHIKIFADIKKKHASHAITADVSLIETARTAEFFQADGVIVTGNATGMAPIEDEVSGVRAAAQGAVLVGSGVAPENVESFMDHSDALIVGSSLKQNGLWSNRVDPARVRALVKVVDAHKSLPKQRHPV